MPSKVLIWTQGDLRGPASVWASVPECCEEERDEQVEVVAPEPAIHFTLEGSDMWRPIVEIMLFPFIPADGQSKRQNGKDVR